MSRTKAKNDEQTLSSRSFVALWAGSYAAFWMTVWIFLEYRAYRPYQFNMSSFAWNFIVILLTSMLQWRVGERFFKQSMRGWVAASVVGSVIAGLAFLYLQPSFLLTSALVQNLPIAMAQMVWLCGRTKSASVWLLMLASLMAMPVFVFPFREYDALWEMGALPFFVLLLGLIQGVIQATVIRYLWTQPKDAEKRKMDVATDGQSEQARVQRLEEHETNEMFEQAGDEQVQYEAR